MWQRFLIVLLFLALTAPLAQAVPSAPTMGFTDNGDGTVTSQDHRIDLEALHRRTDLDGV